MSEKIIPVSKILNMFLEEIEQDMKGMQEEDSLPFTPEEIKKIAKVKPQGMELEVSSSKKVITFTDPVEAEKEISFSKTSKGIHQDDNAGGEDYANVDELVKGFTSD